MRVVIAEDTVLLREGLAGLLEDAGHEVVGRAGDADALLALVGEHEPDLAVVDVRMPPDYDDEGTRAAAEIRALAPGHRACSCSPSTSRRATSSSSSSAGGGFGYLLKDRVLDVDDFLDAARRVERGRLRARPAGRRHADRRAASAASALGRAHAARARGARADGRGPHERRHRASGCG